MMRGMLSVAGAALAATLAMSDALQAQVPVEQLLRDARVRLEVLDADSAVRLLQQILDPEAGATARQRVRGYVLLGISELTRGNQPIARQAFSAALTIDQDQRVDSLSHLHADLSFVFAAVRTMVRERLAGPPAILDLDVEPRSARVTVDGVPWLGVERRQPVTPGLHVVRATRVGYQAVQDTVRVDTGTTVTHRRQLRPIQRAGAVETAMMGVLYMNLSEGPLNAPAFGASLAATLGIDDLLAIAGAAEVLSGGRASVRLSLEVSPFLGGVVRPYLFGGAHWASYSETEDTFGQPVADGEKSGVGAHVGGGMRVFLGGPVAVRVEVRIAQDGFLPGYTSVKTALLGLSLYPGSR